MADDPESGKSAWQGPDFTHEPRRRDGPSGERRPVSFGLALLWVIVALGAVVALLVSVNIGSLACDAGDTSNGCARPLGQPLLALAGCALVAVAGWQIFRGYSAAGVSYFATALIAFVIWAATL